MTDSDISTDQPYEQDAPLAALIWALGYRGNLPRIWTRPAGIVLAILLALALGAGIGLVVRAVKQAVAPSAGSTQVSAAELFTLNGVIEQLSTTQLLVENMLVRIDRQTVTNGIPVVGAFASIQGFVLEDGSLQARTITIAGASSAVPPTLTSAATQEPALPPPTIVPSIAPGAGAAVVATVSSSAVPIPVPSAAPTVLPTMQPTAIVTAASIVTPNVIPTTIPTVIPTVASTIAIPTAAPTTAPTIVNPTVAPTTAPTIAIPTAAPTVAPTAVPTQVPPTSVPVVPTVVPSVIIADEPIVVLRTLINTGMADGRVQTREGMALLKGLDDAQVAVGKGDMKQLRDRLRDMQKKIRDQVREGKLEPSFAQQILDGIDLITRTYNIQLPNGN